MVDDFELVFLVRVTVLFIGAFICWVGSMKAMKKQEKIPKSSMSKFVKNMIYSVALLGLIMFLIALGNLLVYYLASDWTYMFLVSAGLVGLATVGLFIYGFYDISRYVGG